MKRLLVSVALVVAVVVSVGAYYRLRGNANPVQVMTAPVSRGDVVQTVAATGTLEAVTTVQVGTQVSGTVSELHADFNSVVRKGQVIAKLDPALFEAQLEQAKANLVKSKSDVEKAKVAVEDAQVKLNQATALHARKLIPDSDLETAQVTYKSAVADLQSLQSQVAQAQASVDQNQVNLEHTVITAPIDGIVIQRSVDIGQTVAASFQSPTVFIIAADLTKMQVNASIDEADIGQIKPGETGRFRVDAYPSEEFTGTVSQVRLQPATVQNVVTYSTIITVPNPDLKLKPGMTANVNVEVARRTNVLRVPSAAIRFRPTEDLFAALHQATPSDARGPSAGGTRVAANGQGAASFRQGGDQSPAGGRLAAGATGASHQAQLGMLFGPSAPGASTPGRVWLYVDKQLKPVKVRLGISDGTNTEVVSGGLNEGMQVVTSAFAGGAATAATGQRSGSPLMGPMGPPRR